MYHVVSAYVVDATCGRWYGNLLRAKFPRRARVKSAASSKPGVTTVDESGTLWGYGYQKTTRSPRIAIESHSRRLRCSGRFPDTGFSGSRSNDRIFHTVGITWFAAKTAFLFILTCLQLNKQTLLLQRLNFILPSDCLLY